MADRHIWERQPEETSKSYNSFVIYRDLGVNRTQEKTLEVLGKRAGYMRVLQEWSSANDWVIRCAAWDAHIEQAARRKIEADAVAKKSAMIQRHSAQGRAMQKKGVEHLTAHDIEKASDAIRAIQVGIAIERAACGLPEYLMSIADADDATLLRQYAALIASLVGADSADEKSNADDQDDQDFDGRIIKLG